MKRRARVAGIRCKQSPRSLLLGAVRAWSRFSATNAAPPTVRWSIPEPEPDKSSLASGPKASLDPTQCCCRARNPAALPQPCLELNESRRLQACRHPSRRRLVRLPQSAASPWRLFSADTVRRDYAGRHAFLAARSGSTLLEHRGGTPVEVPDRRAST